MGSRFFIDHEWMAKNTRTALISGSPSVGSHISMIDAEWIIIRNRYSKDPWRVYFFVDK
ncbi:hypothetical protein PN4B1_31380 [Paenibacillus naphthalenovorans]|nr:hypothetical protein PN4B1_31380 [Paenibacillus naphthalenovorans]